MYKTAEFVSINHQLLFCYFYYTNSIVNFSFDDHNPGIIQPAYIRNVARKMSGLSKEAMVAAASCTLQFPVSCIAICADLFNLPFPYQFPKYSLYCCDADLGEPDCDFFLGYRHKALHQGVFNQF